MSDTTKPSRWLRFGLRTFLLVVLLIAAFFAGRAPLEQRIRDLERASQERERELAERHVSNAIKSAEMNALVAKAEYEEALEINKRSGAISALELDRLEANWKLAELAAEKAGLPMPER